MNPLYNLTAHITFYLLKIYGLFNPKMKLFIKGRKETFRKLSVLKKEDRVVWFHAASLGEFEQARPIIEEVKEKYPKHKIVVTFFSPSGYEIRKEYPLADVICYLPFDTRGRVKRFINLTHPELAIIIKYEFWPNLLHQLKQQSIPTILVSGIFRKDQNFFKSSGGWMRKALHTFNHFFVQDVSSKELLESIELENVTVSGDTRFDRVVKILEQDNQLDFIEEFKNNRYTLVAGSTWPEGEEFLVNYINDSSDEKFIIAPHNMNAKAIEKLQASIQKTTVLFSEKEQKNLADFDVFIIDTIGLLTKIYSYADAVYVGGAFKTGLHNILEPATFGVPVVIGTEYGKFKEAKDLVALKGCISVTNQQEFSSIFKQLKEDQAFRQGTGEINQQYIQENKGATKKIMNYINEQINNN
ncbi:3-deoxy-D-manno-octulosonic acid transferase [Pseudotenacibaculum haliotis]|uniref:3-deoxy-D-manno-octulosonic acid transferase n=1 Tax=Pseudotenacibaculum haliotis TaxID=1862138 RepID=A0ABW5LSI9_9FLAO